jgi:hypothetical protein
MIQDYFDALLHRGYYDDWFITVIAWFVTLLVLWLLFMFACWIYNAATATWREPFRVIVESKHYIPSSTRTGVGPAIGGNGGVAVTTSHEAEKWVTMFVDEHGGRHPFESEEVYEEAEVGSVWMMEQKIGKLDEVSDTRVWPATEEPPR